MRTRWIYWSLFPLVMLLLSIATPANAAGRNQALLRLAIRQAAPANVGAQSLAVPVLLVNQGEGKARKVAVSGALNPAAGQLVDVQFSATNAWVTLVRPDRIEAAVEQIDAGQTVTMTVRYIANAGGPSLIQGRLSVTWEDKAGGGLITSNPAPAPGPNPAAAQPAPTTPVQLLVLENGRRLLFNAGNLAPREPVGVWLNAPDGRVIPLLVVDNRDLAITAPDRSTGRAVLPYAEAGSLGTVSLFFSPTELAAGSYTLVLRGTLSEVSGTVGFQVQP